MNALQNIISGLFNRLSGQPHGKRAFDQARAQGDVLDALPIYQEQTGLLLWTPAAFYYKEGAKKATLVYQTPDDTYITRTLTVEHIRHDIQQLTISNYHRVHEMLLCPEMHKEADIRSDYLNERAALERTIALFEKRTGLHIDDRLRTDGRRFYSKETSGAHAKDATNIKIDLAIEGTQETGGGKFEGDVKSLPKDKLAAAVEAQGMKLYDWVSRN